MRIWLLSLMTLPVALGAGGAALSASRSTIAPSRNSSDYSWPIKPFDQPHPVRALVGDPRTIFRPAVARDPLAGPGNFSLHDGVDIDAPNGTPVYPVVSGVVQRVRRDLATPGVDVAAADGRLFVYTHILPVVSEGQAVTARQTILGRVHIWADELHFSELSAAGQVVNPLLPGHLTPYTDNTTPTVAGLQFRDERGNRLAPFALHGRVMLVAEAYDTPMPVPPRGSEKFRLSKFARDGFPVSPASLTWSLAVLGGGRVVVRPSRIVDFDRGNLSDKPFWRVYARGTYQNRPAIGNRMHALMPGRYLFKLTRASLDTRALANGVYVVTVTAIDASGNRGSLSERLEIWNREARNRGDASEGLDIRSTDARAVVAAFARPSYRPGARAVLELWSRYPSVRIDLLHVGPESERTTGAETMSGVVVGRPIQIAAGRTSATVEIGDWESGVYAARLTTAGRVGFAPFIVRPKRLGDNRVAVVQPTNTWQAYNFRDADGDGAPDTWYYNPSHTTIDASRPFLNRGVPPHFRQYDLGFLHWLAHGAKHVDMLAQEDVERISGRRLARLYRLIIFPGHHEYVTRAEYDGVQKYHDLGGNLAFLSANNFFYRVDRDGPRITRIGRWRDLGRPEAALIGVQYFRWNLGTYNSRQYVARGVHTAPWLFAGTGIHNGDRFGWWGIEVDGRTAASPPTTRILASMPNAFGTGRDAEMTYYETSTGARVFSAGAFTLAGAASEPTASRLLENVWQRLTPDEPLRDPGGR